MSVLTDWKNRGVRDAFFVVVTASKGLPNVVHSGQARAVRARRALVLDDAHAQHPNRFRRPPQPPKLPGSSWISKYLPVRPSVATTTGNASLADRSAHIGRDFLYGASRARSRRWRCRRSGTARGH